MMDPYDTWSSKIIMPKTAMGSLFKAPTMLEQKEEMEFQVAIPTSTNREK